jgi:uncharacterized protein (TIGR03083 family)
MLLAKGSSGGLPCGWGRQRDFEGHAYTSAVAEIGGLYAQGRERLCELVFGLSPADCARFVPACPKWAVRDVIAHLAGGCTDVLAGNIAGVTTEPWADAQVRRRQDHTFTQVLEEWSLVAPRVEAIAGTFPPPLLTMWLLDLTAHEQDVRGALMLPGARETHALLTAVDFLVQEGLHRQLVGRQLGPVAVRTPVAGWMAGGSAPPVQMPPSASNAGGATTAVELSLFEAFRALTGRRSAGQIARYDWTTDPEPFLGAFEFGTFTMRTTDLVE